MADIEIQRTPSLQEGRPDAVHILLISDNGEVKAAIDVWPRFEKPPFTDAFRVEIHKGESVLPDVDIRLTL